MSHPVRAAPHHHSHHHQALKRIEEDPHEGDDNEAPGHSSHTSLSLNSEWFQTPKSSRNLSSDSDDDEDDDQTHQQALDPSYSINNGHAATGDHRSSSSAILLPNSQLLSKEVLQRKLRFHFMSPIDKWRLKRRFPLKLLFQLAKILLVTSQIMYFGNEMSRYLNYEDSTRTAFREMLLDGWDPTRDIFAYPPSTGTFAVYTSDAFYRSVNYAIAEYSNLSSQSVGTFGYDTGTSVSSSGAVYPVILLEKTFFAQRTIDPSKYIFNFNDAILKEEAVIANWAPAGDPAWANFSAQEYFTQRNFTINFDTMISFTLRFPLRTIYYSADPSSTLRCYDLNVTINYDNTEHDGEIPIELTTERRVHECKSADIDGQHTGAPQTVDSTEKISISRTMSGISWPLALNWIVIIACCLSIILCLRSVYRGQLLRAETDQFFSCAFERHLQLGEAMEFLDLWIVMIAINDVLIISGTLLKIKLESSDIISGTVFTDCSLMLGIGNLLVWLGLLRYLSYFTSYNILIITVRKSIPNILRFLLCAVLIYSGFCFCGWVVLGPYHLKFRTLSSTSECLFSLMNGDDMFATFFSTDVRAHGIIWWFSRIYFYLFISLAIYVIVSLFIAIILDSYESIRDLYAKEPEDLKSPLQKFIDEYPLDCTESANFTNNSIVDHLHRHISRWFTFGR